MTPWKGGIRNVIEEKIRNRRSSSGAGERKRITSLDNLTLTRKQLQENQPHL